MTNQGSRLKICYSCNEEKDANAFAFRNKSTGVRRGKCKDCVKKDSRKHYEENKDDYLARSKVRNKKVRDSNRGFLKELKESTPCKDCGVSYPYYVMQFDHVRGSKLFNLGDMAHHTRSAILEEVSKCEIVCANCHAIRTHERSTAR